MPAHVNITLDTTAPAFAAEAHRDGDNSVVLTITDVSSDAIEVRINGGEWEELATPLVLPPTEADTLSVELRDDVWNVSEPVEVPISGEPPVSPWNPKPSPYHFRWDRPEVVPVVRAGRPRRIRRRSECAAAVGAGAISVRATRRSVRVASTAVADSTRRRRGAIGSLSRSPLATRRHASMQILHTAIAPAPSHLGARRAEYVVPSRRDDEDELLLLGLL